MVTEIKKSIWEYGKKKLNGVEVYNFSLQDITSK